MSEFSADKLANRGSAQAQAILTNAQDFVVIYGTFNRFSNKLISFSTTLFFFFKSQISLKLFWFKDFFLFLLVEFPDSSFLLFYPAF